MNYSLDSSFLPLNDDKSPLKPTNDNTIPSKPPSKSKKKISFSDQRDLSFQRKPKMNPNTRRTAKSLNVFGNETIEQYFQRVETEKKKKKNMIQEEIKEQMMSLTQIFPQMNLRHELKLKWFRVRTKLRLHVSMLQSHREIKIYGLNPKYKNFEEESHITSSKVQMKKWILHPSSRFKSIWSFILFILLMYTAYITPIEIAFVDDFSESLSVVEYMVNALFIIDMLVALNSSYFDHNNQLIQSRGKIIKHYVKGWFIIDLMAAFPFEIIENDSSANVDNSVSFRNVNSTNLKQLLKLPRIYRLFRLARLIKMVTKTKHSFYLNKMQEMFKLNSGFISMINYLIIISVAINFMGCVWFFEAKIRGFEPTTWVYELQLLNETDYTLYTYSIYWAIQTLSTVGYGDVHAFNTLEQLICIIWMSLGAGFYSYSVGSLSSVITNLNTRKAKLRKKGIILDEFCKENQIPKHLHLKLRRALEYANMKTLFTIDEKIEFLKELPTDLKYEISKLTRENSLLTFPFFKNRDKLFIAEFVLFLSPLKLQTGEIIFEKGQYPNSVYFIMHGRVGLIEGHEKLVYKSFVEGGYFGEVEIFSECVRLSTSQALTDCEFLTINRHEFEMILNNFPDVKLELKRVSVEKQKRIEENRINVQSLLPLSKKSTFWIKRRKTIRAFNIQMSKKLIEDVNNSLKNRVFVKKNFFITLFMRLATSFSFLNRWGKKRINKIAPSIKINEGNENNKESFMNSNVPTSQYLRNKTILDFIEAKKYDPKNSKKKEKIENQNQSSQLFRFSNKMTKGILKYQEQNPMLQRKKSSEDHDLPWKKKKKRSQSLFVNLEKENYNSIKESHSLQCIKNYFIQERVSFEVRKKVKVSEQQSEESSEFLLMDSKKECVNDKTSNLEEKWEVLEKDAEEIMTRLNEANNSLILLREKMKKKKQEK